MVYVEEREYGKKEKRSKRKVIVKRKRKKFEGDCKKEV